MARRLDLDLNGFREYIKRKNLFLWGAGTRGERICGFLENPPMGVIDSNPQKWGSILECDRWKLPVMSESTFYEKSTALGIDTVVLLIVPAFFSLEIFDKLNASDLYRELDCFLMNDIINNVKQTEFSFSDGDIRIPKVIHYCWFGGGEIPQEFQRYIEGWRLLCPEYEIQRWDESNYDVKKNRYMRESYENRQWGFVSDYARLDILYENGGIYFDTDVELIKKTGSAVAR